MINHHALKDLGLPASEAMEALHSHVPVMLAEAMEWLTAPTRGQTRETVWIDATFGAGGYTAALLKALPRCRVFAFDRDPEAVRAGSEKLAKWASRLELMPCAFSGLESEMAGRASVDGLVADLGVSSLQLDDPARGFSLQRDGPLDMRMDQSKGQPAHSFLRRMDEDTLALLISRLGDERYARRIARVIVARMRQFPLPTTRELAEVIWRAVPPRARVGSLHPATRTFQAIRIAINEELDELTTFLDKAKSLVRPGGRLVIVSFHSGEHRIVRQFARGTPSESGFACLTPRAITPGKREIETNSRSRSGQLRAFERIPLQRRARARCGTTPADEIGPS